MGNEPRWRASIRGSVVISSNQQVSLRQVFPVPGMAQMLDCILDRKFRSLPGRLPILQVVLVLRLLQFFGRRAPMGVSPRRLSSHTDGRPPDRDLVGTERGQGRGPRAAEMGFEAAV